MSTEQFTFRRSLQLVEMLQTLVASFNPRATLSGTAFSFKGFAGSIVYDLDLASLFVFDPRKVMVYGPGGHGGADRSHDPRADQIMCSLLDQMMSEYKLHAGKKMLVRAQASR